MAEHMLNPKIRDDFPIIAKSGVIYLDNACMSLRPRQVIDAINAYYTDYGGCAGRSQHRLGKETERRFEEARAKIAAFINAQTREVVFTKNTTEAINLVANTLDFSQRNKVVTSNVEHHSALVPFQMLAKRKKISLEFVTAKEDGTFDPDQWAAKIDRRTRLVVVHHTTNSIGTRAPLREITKAAHDSGALTLVDAAQGIPHSEVNFKRENFDFISFSGHKMLGPTGTGCLVAKAELLEELPPFLVGGETIEKVTLSDTVFAKPPHKFEGGLQHYAGLIGFGAAVDYLKKVGMRNIEKHEYELTKAVLEGLQDIAGIKIYGPVDADLRSAIITFNVAGAKSPHDIAIMLDELKRIAVRSGVFCAEPAMMHLGAPQGAVRASLYLYNTKEEVEIFLDTLKKITSMYR